MEIGVVVTTIGKGDFLDIYVNKAMEEGIINKMLFIIIPDRKTPKELYDKCKTLEKKGINILCPTIEEQESFLKMLGSIANIIPYNSDNRRNIGFLMAYARGCRILISLDDDNIPPQNETPFFSEHINVIGREIEMDTVYTSSRWFNPCDLLELNIHPIYSRGFPYHLRFKNSEMIVRRERGKIHLNMGLWLNHPDVDAITCSTFPHVKSLSLRGRSLMLGQDIWCPINTQNTAISRNIIPCFYFVRMNYPVFGVPIDRDGDIFTGYFCQACMHRLGFRVRVGTPISIHIRNPHEFLSDLTKELACILMLEDITKWLQEVELEGNSCEEIYLNLAELLDDAVERFSGAVWNDITRGYIHYLTYCMRSWIKAIERLNECELK